MHPELEALLALQKDDDVVEGVMKRLSAIEPRLTKLEQVRSVAERDLHSVQATVETDEKRQRELERRLSDHRQRQERNVAHLDNVKRLREATAAMAQVETGKKILLEEEDEFHALAKRISDGHQSIKAREKGLQELLQSQEAERAAIASEKAAMQAELNAAHAVRKATATGISAPLLSKYDRIRGRRKSQAVFALSGTACGCCDTAIPVQRSKVMATSGAIEVCEGCGVLLYATI